MAGRRLIGRRVADIASGSGYGTRILIDSGVDFVTGIELDEGAAMAAASAYPDPDVNYVRGDAHRIPFRSGSLDAIVSFETIEHLSSPAAFLDEVGRILKDEGLLILSTPNASISGWNRGIRNPCHRREFTPEELSSELVRRFSTVELLGQIVRPGFGITPWDPKGPSRGGQGLRRAAWKLRHKLIPFIVKDAMARLLFRRGFYPGEYDFLFDRGSVGSAHVIVAVCGK